MRAQRRLYATATVVAAHDDVSDLEHVDGELHDRQAVEVGVDDHVGDIAVDEDLARQQADDLVGRHAAVGTTDPQVVGRLLARKFGKKLRVLAANAFRPLAVVLEELVEAAHVGATLNVRGRFGKVPDFLEDGEGVEEEWPACAPGFRFPV